MNTLTRQLTLKDGISLALGSVIGSGVLFLPSLTFALSGPYTLWVWIISTSICIPLIYIFSDMVREIPDERGIEGFVTHGLGRHAGAAIPLIFLGTVSIGMPSSALIVGEYVKNFLNGSNYIQIITAFIIVFSSVLTNLAGIKISSTVQLTIAFLIFFIGITIIILAPPTKFGQAATVFSPSLIRGILPGIVVSFWAFAGFENLTFIAGEFKNPARDFKLSMLIALLLCGILYLLLSESCASHIPREKINPIAGLYQLSETLSARQFSTFVISLFAFFAVLINFNSWIWGISRLIYSSAKQKKLPIYFSFLNSKQIPSRAIILLACIFSTVLLISTLFPNFLRTILIVVSTNFVFIYTLCLISYVRFKKIGFLKILSFGLLTLLIPLLLSSKWLLLYPLLLFAVGAIIDLSKQKKLLNS